MLEPLRRMLLSVCTLMFAATAVALAAKPGDWPQWRGPNRDGNSAETGLLTEWPEDGPAVVWQTDRAGVGYSSVAVADGRVITQGDLDGVEHIIAFNESDGSLLWAVQPKPAIESLESRIDEQVKRLDRNSDGVISDIEAMQALGRDFVKVDSQSNGDPETVAKQRVAALMAELDKDDNESLDIFEAPSALLDNNAIDTADRDADRVALAEERTDDVFDAIDRDGDGKITREETRGTPLQRLGGRMDQREPGERRGDGVITRDEAKQYFADRERGKDGRLTTGELVAFFSRQYPGRDGILERSDIGRYFGGYRNGQGDGPRGTPTIEGNRVYTIGGFGDVTCLDVKNGDTIWHVHLVDDLGGGRPGWGYSESPLIDGDRVIVTPGRQQGCVAALDKRTGDVIWRSTDVTDNAHYSSAIVDDVLGTRQIIQFTRERVVGLDAETGNLLWDYRNSANGTANCATPIYHDGCVFSSSAYGTGGGLVKLSRDGDRFSAEEVYFDKKFANHHGGLVLVGDHIYGMGANTLICSDFKTGDIAWQSRGVGKGSLTFADGRLYCLGERNAVGLVEANPREYVETGRFEIPRSGRPSWAHPVVANGRFYIRDQGTLTSYAVR